MTWKPEADRALSSFPPLLVELVRADAPHLTLAGEGFTHFEVSAVRTLLRRLDTQHSVSGGLAAATP